MNRKLVIGLASATLALGAVASINTLNESAIHVTAAKDEIYCYAGTANGWADLETKRITDSSGISQEYTFEAKEEFKFKKPGSWNGEIGAASIAGSAAYCFGGEGNGNIICNVAGTYNLSITDSKLLIELVSFSEVIGVADVYVQLQGWENTYLYMFDEKTDPSNKYETLGGWPGKKAYDYTVSTNFKGSDGGIAHFKVPYVNLANTYIVLNNGSGTKSPDYPLNDGYFYWKNGGEGIGYLDDGQAAKVVYDFDKQYGATASTCSTPSDDAARLWNEYNALSGSARSKASSSVITSSNYTVGAVAYELYKIAKKAGKSVAAPAELYSAESNIVDVSSGQSNYLLVAITIAAIASIGGLFLLRKKNEE